MTRRLPGPTDEVSITTAGRPLDTAEKAIEFFAGLDADRSSTAIDEPAAGRE